MSGEELTLYPRIPAVTFGFLVVFLIKPARDMPVAILVAAAPVGFAPSLVVSLSGCGSFSRASGTLVGLVRDFSHRTIPGELVNGG